MLRPKCEAAFHLGARGLRDGFCTGTVVGDVPTDLRRGAFFPCPNLSVATFQERKHCPIYRNLKMGRGKKVK